MENFRLTAEEMQVFTEALTDYVIKSRDNARAVIIGNNETCYTLFEAYNNKKEIAKNLINKYGFKNELFEVKAG